MNIAGLIFADPFDGDLAEMTAKRTLAAVPFGARYRVVDFTISNMVNAGMLNIGVLTTQKYQSLMHHVRGGESWDLARKWSGISFLPPYVSHTGLGGIHQTRLEGLQNNLTFLRREITEKYVLMSSTNYVTNIDYEKMLEYHISTGARITCLYAKAPLEVQTQGLPVMEYDIAKDGQIQGFHHANISKEPINIMVNCYLLEREDLISLLEKTISEGGHSFREALLQPLIDAGEKVMGYQAEEEVLFMFDLSLYLKNSLRLLDKDLRNDLFHRENRPIATNVKDSAPARYGSESKVVNSLIADGTIIEGEVRNSIIFRGVRIGKGAVVENSVIMQDTTVEDGAHLNYTVLDKNVVVLEGRSLSGYITHPFYLGHGVVI